MRGIFYLDGGRFIEDRYVIEHYALDDEGAAPVVVVLDQFGQEFAHEPGILVRRAMAKGEDIASFFSIEIWQSFKMYASVEDPTGPDADPDVASLTFGKAV